jgi:hypothetical protein
MIAVARAERVLGLTRQTWAKVHTGQGWRLVRVTAYDYGPRQGYCQDGRGTWYCPARWREQKAA